MKDWLTNVSEGQSNYYKLLKLLGRDAIHTVMTTKYVRKEKHRLKKKTRVVVVSPKKVPGLFSALIGIVLDVCMYTISVDVQNRLELLNFIASSSWNVKKPP